jgi:nicotinamidase-related amidase
MLIKANNSCFLMIDVQEKLIGAVQNSQQILDNCAWLLRLSQFMAIPVLVSEQYPKGLGETVSELLPFIPEESLMEKIHFSCVSSEPCLTQIEETGCHQFILAGIESHVCVLQTALELQEIGKEVFVVSDAVSSRHPHDKEMALARLRDVGIHIVTREMVLFEWAHQAATEKFRQLSREFLR